jgi:hypothetical protein
LIDEEEFMDIPALHRQGLTYAEIGRIVGRDYGFELRLAATSLIPLTT